MERLRKIPVESVSDHMISLISIKFSEIFTMEIIQSPNHAAYSQ